MLAEAHDPPLMAKAFDLDYAWPLHSTLAAVFSKGVPARDLHASWEEERSQFPKGTLHMRISDDHDEERAIVRFGKGGALAASAFMFTLDGVPLLYEGMEAGDTAESGAPPLFEEAARVLEDCRTPARVSALLRGMIALRGRIRLWSKARRSGFAIPTTHAS